MSFWRKKSIGIRIVLYQNKFSFSRVLSILGKFIFINNDKMSFYLYDF